MKIAGSGSGSVSQMYGSEDLDQDPYQAVTDPVNWLSYCGQDVGRLEWMRFGLVWTRCMYISTTQTKIQVIAALNVNVKTATVLDQSPHPPNSKKPLESDETGLNTSTEK
jgi:hypothetical protein